MGEPTDHRADIYALGVVMYEMFSGRVPFEADSYMGVLTKHMYMAPTPFTQFMGTEKLAALEDVTLRCLEKKPEHRYATLRDLIQDLDRVFVATGRAGVIPRHRRATPPSVLADELELPSREELRLGLRQAGLKPWPRWPIALMGGLFLFGIGTVLALRKQPRAAPVTVAPAAAIPSATRAAVTAPLPNSSALLTPSEPPLGTASPGPVQPVASPVSAKAARHAKGRPVSVSVAPAAPKKPTTLGASEIVDPWAN
jgi:serine/threonine-protein kinase